MIKIAKMLGLAVAGTALLFVGLMIAAAAGWIGAPPAASEKQPVGEPPSVAASAQAAPAAPSPQTAPAVPVPAPSPQAAPAQSPEVPATEQVPEPESSGIVADDVQKARRSLEAIDSVLRAALRVLPVPRDSNLRVCGEQMRKLMPLAKAAYDHDDLPIPLMTVGAAGAPLQSCVTCSDSAEEYCRDADSEVAVAKAFLDRVERELRERRVVRDDFDSIKALKVQVAKDMEKGFDKAKAKDRCLAASRAYSAYNQALEPDEITRWKAIRGSECLR